MSVEFHEEDPILGRLARPPRQVSLFTRITYKLKLAKTEEEAQRVILIAALLCIAAAGILFLNIAGIV